ncbi:hypothetical protein ABEB36_012487 [Hypothenemus hampei]|uniref:Non-structural maintenance of chromosomes element 1 homolog n=1 Tax=Hypothenemus hampei TaxID=57062 RepID=A0ABD1EBH8_HYPHA
METNHRYLVQYMLRNGSVTLTKALSYCKNLPEPVEDFRGLKIMILEINRKIQKNSFKIVLTTCEVTSQEQVVWLNLKNDDISKFQIAYNPLELEYFHAILQEILNSEDHRLLYVTVLNITSTLTAQFSRDSGQKVLTKWFKGGYYIQSGDFVYLGSRLILEFTSYLKAHMPNQICPLCSELAFTGQHCNACGKLLHSHCISNYLKTQKHCPSCNSLWTGSEHNRTSNQNGIDTIEAYVDET